MGAFEHFPAQKVLKHLTESEAAIAANSEAIEELQTSAIPTEFHEWGIVRDSTSETEMTASSEDYNKDLNLADGISMKDDMDSGMIFYHYKTFDNTPKALNANAAIMISVKNESEYNITVSCCIVCYDGLADRILSTSANPILLLQATLLTPMETFDVPANGVGVGACRKNIVGTRINTEISKTEQSIVCFGCAWVSNIEDFTESDTETKSDVLSKITVYYAVMTVDGTYYPA